MGAPDAAGMGSEINAAWWHVDIVEFNPPPPPNWWKYAVTVSVSGREAPRDVTSMRWLKKGAILEP